MDLCRLRAGLELEDLERTDAGEGRRLWAVAMTGTTGTNVSPVRWRRTLVRDERIGDKGALIGLAAESMGGGPNGVMRLADHALARRFALDRDDVLEIWDALCAIGYARRLADDAKNRRTYLLQIPGETEQVEAAG